jgi:hypothetical protein
MSGERKPWHNGLYRKLAPLVVARADADPSTRCGQLPDGSLHPDGCGLTKRQHGRQWQAGHVVRGKIVTTPFDLMPHCARCNASSGARDGNRMRRRITSRDWYA